MSFTDYLPVVIQLLLAFVIASAILTASHIFGQRAKKNAIKDSAYECGMLPIGPSHPRIAVKFYLTAMLFILFDVEIVFLIPWVLTYREFLAAGIPILTPILFFLVILFVGLFYEFRKGALEWEK